MLWGLSLCGRFTLLKHRFHSICHRCWRKSPGAYEVHMRAEAHNIAIAWMQSVAVALIWWQSLVDLKSVLADPANFGGPGSLVLMIITFPTTIIISNMSNDLPSAHSKSDFLALLAVKSAQSGAIWYLSCVHNRRCLALCHCGDDKQKLVKTMALQMTRSEYCCFAAIQNVPW